MSLCRECKNFPGLGKMCGVSRKLMSTGNQSGCNYFCRKSIKKEPLFPGKSNIEIVKTGPTGQVQVICQKHKDTTEARDFIKAVNTMQNVDKENCPYSYRYI